jgi:hypothetical protein
MLEVCETILMGNLDAGEEEIPGSKPDMQLAPTLSDQMAACLSGSELETMNNMCLLSLHRNTIR